MPPRPTPRAKSEPRPEAGGDPAAQLDEQLRHVQRLVLQGELAATTVHEISNLLTIVLFNAGLLRLHHKDDPASLKYVDPILHAAGVVGSLCTQLRDLSRPAPAQYRVVDLVAIARRTFTLLEQILSRKLLLETESDAPVLVMADPAQLDQILINLVLNARDATTQPEGRIRIRIGHGPAAPRTERQRYLEVTDNGTGMTAAVRRQIFKPFFTTKPVGEGTGLGMVTVRRLMQGIGGHVRLTSQPGQGTSVHLLFPAPPADAEADYRRAALDLFVAPPAPRPAPP